MCATRRWLSHLLLLTIATGLSATLASAQSIVGTVRDVSGAAVPGVRVEVASPALIEQSRSVVSDANGQYAVVGLRPGSFTVTFTKTGFTPVTTAGVIVIGTFVATVNAELAIAAVSETTTVRPEELPLDVHSSARQTTLTAAMIAAIPTGRSLANLGVLVPGMVTVSARSQNDVGGVNNLQNIFMAIHGGRVTDERVYIDGVTLRNIQSEGHAINFTPDTSSTEEVSIDDSGTSAEAQLGGVSASYVLRAGGDTFHGSVFATAANRGFQGNNITADLRARGLVQPDVLKRTYDVNPTMGGPILRARAWFYAAARAQSNQNYVGGVFENRNAGDASAWSYVPDYAQPGVFQITQQSANARITALATPRNTVSLFFERQWRVWDEGSVNRAPEAFSRFRFPQNQIAIAGWSSPVSNHLLLEARGAYHAEVWNNIGGDDLLPNNRSLVPVLEQGGAFPGLMYRGKNGVYTGQSAPAMLIGRFVLTYVGAGHTVKAGVETLRGTNTNPNTFNQSGLQYRFNDGVPNQITEFAAPYTMVWRVAESGAFVEDSWRLGRLTLNDGLRLDTLSTSFPEQHLGPGPLTPGRDLTLPGQRFYAFKDLSPRLGAAFDLTGSGRTVLTASAGRYVVAVSPATGNPIANLPLTVTRTWSDADHDYVPDCDIADPGRNGECGAVSDANFGGATPSLAYDPGILRGWNVRPYDWEFAAGIQREMMRPLVVSLTAFRRIYGNFVVQDNLATTTADYTRFTVRAPIDPRLPGGGGYPIGGLFDLNPDKRGQVRNFVTSAAAYGRQIEHWNGVDATMNLRLPSVLVQGGVSSGRSLYDICDVARSVPEILGTAAITLAGRAVPASIDQCRIQTVWLTQAKWMARYSIPGVGIDVAGTWQSVPGPEIQANYIAGNAVVQPSLGRPLSGTANTSVTLLTPGRTYGDRLNQVDLRVAKIFHAGDARTALNFDLYNAFNASPVTTANLIYSGSGRAWLQPQAILPPRLFKVSVQFDF